MAEGGDPDSTNPFDSHGNHHDDNDSEDMPLLPFGKEKNPVVKTSTSTPKSSSSHHHNPSFIDETPSGVMNAREEMREEANNRTKIYFPRSNEKDLFGRINDEGQVTVSLTDRKDNRQYPILDANNDPLFDDKYRALYKGKRVPLPPKLRKALGKSVFEEIADNNEAIEREEIELDEINKEIPNTVGEERKSLEEKRDRMHARRN